jgi:membrane-bound acyltransferase YfiQ involved in biofilm formation
MESQGSPLCTAGIGVLIIILLALTIRDNTGEVSKDLICGRRKLLYMKLFSIAYNISKK